MNHLNQVTQRLSLRAPQAESLARLATICNHVPPKKGIDLPGALAKLRTEFPTLADFEREFPSYCFSLATGVGKTRLMGAFIAYLHLEFGVRDFFVLAPNLTIYNKLLHDFSRGSPKYVLKGIQEFNLNQPTIISGDNYASGMGVREESKQGTLGFADIGNVVINIFNISKINGEVRGGKEPKIHKMSEYIGEGYFNYLASLPNLVMLMDESHRYRASAGVRAINELKPALGLELTATPFTESSRGPVPFKNVVYDYPLARALEDGFVKEPAVATRKDFNPTGMTPAALERLKLEDGIRLHETVKVHLETYARNHGKRLVKPFILVVARDTSHAKELLDVIRDENFFDGRYKERAIQVDSSTKEDEIIERLLKVEDPNEPTEIVIHVNMLKEGWDVTNLYTIVPLRAANARTLIEQTIGRGLRLPYGEKTGDEIVDRLSIIAHDRFKEIVDEADKKDSPIRLQKLILEADGPPAAPKTVESRSNVEASLAPPTVPPPPGVEAPEPVFNAPEEQKAAKVTLEVIRSFETRTDMVPNPAALQRPEIQREIVAEVERRLPASTRSLFPEEVRIAQVVAKTIDTIDRGTIPIPRITLVPKDEVRFGFHPFKLKCENLRYVEPNEELVTQELRTKRQTRIGIVDESPHEERLEDYIVRGLIDKGEIHYDEHADLLYALASEVVRHFRTYLKTDEAIRKVLVVHQNDIVNFVHAQMLEHYWETRPEFEVTVTRGFTQLQASSYTVNPDERPRDFRYPPDERRLIDRYLFTGFSRCLYQLSKFDADYERIVAMILDRDSRRWFRPASGQFQIEYRQGMNRRLYVPDFVAETSDRYLLIEIKRRADMTSEETEAKRLAALLWCQHATEFTTRTGGKQWTYLLIPHDAVAENMTLKGFEAKYVAEEIVSG